MKFCFWRGPAFVLGLLLCWAGCRAPGVRVEPPPASSFDLGQMDAKWAPFASYLRRAFARVQSRWDRELSRNRAVPPAGTSVTVVLLLSADGKVPRIVDVKVEPGTAGARECVQVLTETGTFPPWTEEMKQKLSAEEEFTFHFFYK